MVPSFPLERHPGSIDSPLHPELPHCGHVNRSQTSLGYIFCSLHDSPDQRAIENVSKIVCEDVWCNKCQEFCLSLISCSHTLPVKNN